MRIPYPEVKEGNLLSSGAAPEVIDAIYDIITTDTENGFTAAQLAIVKDGELIFEDAWGSVNSYDKDGSPLEDRIPATTDTLFDLASNTKMYSVNYAIQHLVSKGELDINTRISDILGSSFYEDMIYRTYSGYANVGEDTAKRWKRELTIKDVQMHQGGFPASVVYYSSSSTYFSGFDGSAATKERTLRSVCKTPLMYEPGTKTLYSDTDYILLGFVVEKITGMDLDTYLKETFFRPMGLDHITYRPLDHGFSKEDIAATELNGNTRDGTVSFEGVRRDTVWCEVHDELAYYTMNGISGHAGLFSNATDLAKLASLMLTGGYNGRKYFTPDVIDAFTAAKSPEYTNWGLGWYREGDGRRLWYFGQGASRDTIGHQGWTGTLTMIDPENDIVIVYLTNMINSPYRMANGSGTFDGNKYISSTLGFVPQLFYLGLQPGDDMSSQLSSLLDAMALDKKRLLQESGADENSNEALALAYRSIKSVADRWHDSMEERSMDSYDNDGNDTADNSV